MLEQHQRQIKVDVEARPVERYGTLQGRQGRSGLAGFEVSQPEPMLQLGIARPADDRFLSDPCGLGQTAQLQIAQHQAAAGLQTVGRDLPGAFEAGGGAGIVVGIEGGLATSEQGLNVL